LRRSSASRLQFHVRATTPTRSSFSQHPQQQFGSGKLGVAWAELTDAELADAARQCCWLSLLTASNKERWILQLRFGV